MAPRRSLPCGRVSHGFLAQSPWQPRPAIWRTGPLTAPSGAARGAGVRRRCSTGQRGRAAVRPVRRTAWVICNPCASTAPAGRGPSKPLFRNGAEPARGVAAVLGTAAGSVRLTDSGGPDGRSRNAAMERWRRHRDKPEARGPPSRAGSIARPPDAGVEASAEPRVVTGLALVPHRSRGLHLPVIVRRGGGKASTCWRTSWRRPPRGSFTEVRIP